MNTFSFISPSTVPAVTRLLSLLASGQKAEGQGSLNLSQEILFIAPMGSGKRECVEKLDAKQEAGLPCTDVQFVYCTNVTHHEAV